MWLYSEPVKRFEAGDSRCTLSAIDQKRPTWKVNVHAHPCIALSTKRMQHYCRHIGIGGEPPCQKT